MKIQVFEKISDILATQWNELAPKEFPFATYEFLSALEANACLGPRTGWSPHFITAWQEQQLLGTLILFRKTNSYGEYIFDFAWAQAYERYGLEYYPKLVSAIPFTPATGPKLSVRGTLNKAEAEAVKNTLLKAALKLSGETQSSSVHALFISGNEEDTYEAAGYFVRHSFQYHCKNQSYKSFEEFLGELRSKRRREILRERQQVQAAGVKIQRLTGTDLKPVHAEWMYEFYLSTVEKMGGYNYLTRNFFREVFETLKNSLLFVVATDANDRPVAGALNYFGEHTLFGRHWGCIDDYKALHFEVCYYQGIEFAIEKGLDLFEAGAQGEHKFQRGFLPSLTYSAHFVEDPRLSPAIQDFVEREKAELQTLFKEYAAHNPFQRTP